MHYLVQENLFTERNYYLILDYKKRVDDEFAEFDTDHKKTLSEMRGFYLMFYLCQTSLPFSLIEVMSAGLGPNVLSLTFFNCSAVIQPF